jgi:hypothetical protein
MFFGKSVVALSAALIVGLAATRRNDEAEVSLFKDDRNRQVIRLSPHLHSSAITGAAPNACVQRGRVRNSKKPLELRFAASAATPC